MHVIDYSDYAWFLLESNGKYFLSGNYTNSAFGYGFPIQLNEIESEKYLEFGRSYIDKLHMEIQNSCPVHKLSKSSFIGREVSKEIDNKMHTAIMSWKQKSQK